MNGGISDKLGNWYEQGIGKSHIIARILSDYRKRREACGEEERNLMEVFCPELAGEEKFKKAHSRLGLMQVQLLDDLAEKIQETLRRGRLLPRLCDRPEDCYSRFHFGFVKPYSSE